MKSVAGNFMVQGYAQMAGGMAGGATGSFINSGNGWDVLQGGLMGAGMAYVNYYLKDSFTFKPIDTDISASCATESCNEDGVLDLGDKQAEDWEIALRERAQKDRLAELAKYKNKPEYKKGESLFQYEVKERRGIFGFGKKLTIENVWTATEPVLYNDKGYQIHEWSVLPAGNVRVHTYAVGDMQTPSSIDVRSGNIPYYTKGNFVYGEGSKLLYKYTTGAYSTLVGY